MTDTRYLTPRANYLALKAAAEKADRRYRKVRGIGTNAEIESARAALSLATRKAEDARRAI